MPGHRVLQPDLCCSPGVLVSVAVWDGYGFTANVLNRDEQVRHGALNWVFVSCVHHDIHLGKYVFNCLQRSPTDYYIDIMAPWSPAYSRSRPMWVSVS